MNSSALNRSASGGNPFVKDVRHMSGSQFASPSVISDLSQQFADASMKTPTKDKEMMKSSSNPQSQNVSKGKGLN